MNLDENLHVGEAVYRRFGQFHVETGRNRLSQRFVAVAGKQLHRRFSRGLETERIWCAPVM
jgi:hypothetical protein